jgi:hypothetical protein
VDARLGIARLEREAAQEKAYGADRDEKHKRDADPMKDICHR